MVLKACPTQDGFVTLNYSVFGINPFPEISPNSTYLNFSNALPKRYSRFSPPRTKFSVIFSLIPFQEISSLYIVDSLMPHPDVTQGVTCLGRICHFELLCFGINTVQEISPNSTYLDSSNALPERYSRFPYLGPNRHFDLLWFWYKFHFKKFH